MKVHVFAKGEDSTQAYVYENDYIVTANPNSGGAINYQLEAYDLTANSNIYWNVECTGGKFSKLFAEYGKY